MPSESIKYLGIYLADSSLSGKVQCNILSKNLKRANGMLMKIRHYVHPDYLKSIYDIRLSNMGTNQQYSHREDF